jgi:hypothetical protein
VNEKIYNMGYNCPLWMIHSSRKYDEIAKESSNMSAPRRKRDEK